LKTFTTTFFCQALIILVLSLALQGWAKTKVGVYYFPGWTEAPSEWWNPPWSKLEAFPERYPLLGFYDDASIAVAEKHIEWMYQYGIDFIVYDWYWDPVNNTPKLGEAINAFLKARNRDSVQFSILWSDFHNNIPRTVNQWDSLTTWWATRYFCQPNYLTIDDKPVVFVFDMLSLREAATSIKQTAKEILDQARVIAKRYGKKGIFFIACTMPTSYWAKGFIPENGFDAVSAYNYTATIARDDSMGTPAISYQELSQDYELNWSWMIRNSPLPFVVPVTSGWDASPWYGKSTVCHSTPALFKMHMDSARSLLSSAHNKTLNMVVICAWNEFGEGSYIEPTKKWGFQYLQVVKQVFGID
jgi:hypothetical protein